MVTDTSHFYFLCEVSVCEASELLHSLLLDSLTNVAVNGCPSPIDVDEDGLYHRPNENEDGGDDKNIVRPSNPVGQSHHPEERDEVIDSPKQSLLRVLIWNEPPSDHPQKGERNGDVVRMKQWQMDDSVRHAHHCKE